MGKIAKNSQATEQFLLDADNKIKRTYMQAMHEVYKIDGFEKAVEVANKMA